MRAATPPPKPKLLPRFPLMTAWGCLFGLVMLATGGLAGLLTGIVALPLLTGSAATQTAAWRDLHQVATAQAIFGAALDGTLRAQVAAETQSALAVLGTQAALDSRQALLNQTATQSQRLVLATLTAAAVQDAQQRTQIALDFSQTQAALQQNATRVQLDFMQTQAALGNPLPAVTAQNQAAPAAVTVTPTPRPSLTPTAAPRLTMTMTMIPIPTATPATPILLPPTDTPAAAAVAALSVDFAAGLDGSRWNAADSDDWRSEAAGLRALRDGAWLLSRERFPAAQRVQVDFTPALVAGADYALLLAVSESDGLTLTLRSSALSITEVRLERRSGALLATQTVDLPLRQQSRLEVVIAGEALNARLNGAPLLVTTLPDLSGMVAGAVGVQFPAEALLQRLEVTSP